MMKVSLNNVLQLVGVSFCLVLFYIGFTETTKLLVSSSLLLLNLIVLFVSIRREAYDILILSFFMLSYSYVPFAHYYLGQDINIRVQAYSDTTVYSTACLCLLFQFVLWMNVAIRKTLYSGVNRVRKNIPGVFYSLVVISFLFTVFGLQGTTILESGGYGKALKTREISGVFPYSIILISLALVYADTKGKQIIVYLLAAFYSVKILLFGGRIEAMQLGIALFLIRFRFIWSRKTAIALGVGAYFLMSLWSIYRADTSVSLFSISSKSLKLTGGDVYYASMRILYLINQGILSTTDRIEAFFYYLSSSIIPFDSLPDLANLSAYLRTQYDTGGGGLAPVFFYAFGGIPLVVVASVLISRLINRMDKNKYYYFYGVMLIATTPRWFAYYPIQPIKFCFYAVLLCIVTESISEKFTKNNV